MKYCVLTFGCRANQADSNDLDREFRARGGVSSDPETADVVVVNTCTVTAAADQAARHAIRRVARANPSARIVATGCYATRNPSELSGAGAFRVVPNQAKKSVSWLVDLSGFAAARVTPDVDFPGPGNRGRTAYPLRVQTGCDERCAYCIVPSTRGPGRSRPTEALVREMGIAADAGFKEMWLTGVHLGSYGRDLRPTRSLVDLLWALDRAAADHDLTFRLSSLEPMDCGEELLDCLAASRRFLPHLHLPLQHASDRVLAAMRRPYTLDRFACAVDGLRRRLPDAAIGTDLIAGFPGERDEDVERQIGYLQRSPITYAHVFAYSDRPGTEAASMPGKLQAAEIRARAQALRAIAAEQHANFLGRQVGRERDALTLHEGSTALTDNYIKLGIPPGRRRNERVRVRIVSARPLLGEMVT